MQNLFVHPRGNSHLGKTNLLVKPTNLRTHFFAHLFLHQFRKIDIYFVGISRIYFVGSLQKIGFRQLLLQDPVQLGVASWEMHDQEA